jgi:hypothetical protein
MKKALVHKTASPAVLHLYALERFDFSRYYTIPLAMKLIYLAAALLLQSCCSASKPGSLKDARRWTLVWSDEFNYAGLPDSSKWDSDTGTGCPNVCG